MPKYGLMIFRRDLRLIDNLALNKLAKLVDVIIPIFILDENQIKRTEKNKYHYSNNAVQFICEAIENLDSQLRLRGGKLFLFMGNPEKIVDKILRAVKIDYIGFNLDFSPYALARDKKLFKYNCITSEDDLTLLPTAKLLNGDKPFKVFGAFYKKVRKFKVNKPEKLPKVKFAKSIPLKTFKGLKTLYEENKNLDRSHMSAKLNMGIISRRQAYLTNKKIRKGLYWSDFFLMAYRFVDNASSYEKYIDPRFDKIKWRTRAEFGDEFDNFWNSTTGILIIDASVRQLRTTGFMDNRSRLLCAVYCCKYLMINMLDPKYGSQAWFSRTLVDCMGANNKMNNNWILDFDLSGRRFGVGISGRGMKMDNSNTVYIKKWLPELKDVADRDIRHWDAKIAKKYNNIHPAFSGDLKKMYQRWIRRTKNL